MTEKSIEAIELQRERWRRARRAMHLIDPQSQSFMSRSLVPLKEGSSVRLSILSNDPEANQIRFDQDFWSWWLEDRPDPVTNQSTRWGSEGRPTADAAVRGWRSGDQWRHYLALYRHGGLELDLGANGSFNSKDSKVFLLSLTVGRLWAAFDLYSQVIERFNIQGPWEICLGFRNTEGSLLGGFAEGWAEPGYRGREIPSSCEETGVLIWHELIQWPDANGAQALAFDFGARVEDAWGMRERRFLAHRGQFAGQFDKTQYGWNW